MAPLQPHAEPQPRASAATGRAPSPATAQRGGGTTRRVTAQPGGAGPPSSTAQPSSTARRGKTPGRGGELRRRFLPPQHGAWAMLGVPFAVGVLASGPAWVHLPLLVAWLSAYLLSYYVFLALKTRRPRRVRVQLAVYALVAAPSAALVLALRPSLWAFAPLLAVLTSISGWFAWRKDERSIVNDLVAVAQACLIAPIAAEAGGAPLGTAWPEAGVLFLYFAGTSCYVKTMIRERGSVRWRRASVTVHLVAAAIAWVLAWPLGVLFTWLLVRAAVLPGYRLTPRTVGFVEIANSAALLALLVLGDSLLPG